MMLFIRNATIIIATRMSNLFLRLSRILGRPLAKTESLLESKQAVMTVGHSAEEPNIPLNSFVEEQRKNNQELELKMMMTNGN